MTSVDNDLLKKFYYYFPEWRGNKEDIKTTYKNVNDNDMNNKSFNFNENIDDKIKFSTWVYIRENLNYYPIFLVIGILLFCYPNYRIFFSPFKKIINWFWNKINIQSLLWNFFAIFVQYNFIHIILLFIISSIIYYSDELLDIDIKKYMKKIWFNSLIFFIILITLIVIFKNNSNNIDNKIKLMCQSWLSPNQNIFSKILKYIIFTQNILLTSNITQCLIGLSVGLHIIITCFKSFVPVMNNGWSGKRLYLLLALILTAFLSLLFITVSYYCSFNNNVNIKNLTSSQMLQIIFTNLNSNVLYNIVVPMLACIIIGFFSYTHIQTNILNSKFKITDNDYKQNQTILKLTNKNDLKEKWKWYNTDVPNGILLNNISDETFDNVYNQTTKGENDPDFKNELQKIIDKYDLPVNSDNLYMILKVNNKIIDGNNNKTNGGSVFLSLCGDLLLYISNVVVVTTFINGRNWGLLPIIGFDTDDESFTYKNWVECLVNVNNDKVIYFGGQKWFGGDLNQNNIDWLKQYNKLNKQQKIIRNKQLELFKKEYFDEENNYISGSLYKFLNNTLKFFFIPKLINNNHSNIFNENKNNLNENNLNENENENESKNNLSENKNQSGGNNTENNIKDFYIYKKIPKEPTTLYKNNLDKIKIQKFQNFNVIGSQYNLGTNDNPLYANIPSNNPIINAHVVTDNYTIIETDNNDNKEKKPLIINVDANFIKGPINDLYKYNKETNNEDYNEFIGSASLFDTSLNIKCIDTNPKHKTLESQTKYCKDTNINYDEENPCKNNIPYDGIINITTKKKSIFRSFLTKLIFLGVDYKKLFLQRYKYSPPSIDIPEESKESGGFSKYLNNLIVGMIIGTIMIDNVSTYISKHYNYIPPNAGVLTKSLNKSKEYLYNSTKILSNMLPNTIFTLITITGWFIIKGILNTVLSPYLTTSVDSILETYGKCNLQSIVSPIIPEQELEIKQFGGKNNNIKYPIKIGKNNIKYYDDKFYDFYKYNENKNKYQKIKNLYINPVKKQLKTKNDIYNYDKKILEELINNL